MSAYEVSNECFSNCSKVGNEPRAKFLFRYLLLPSRRVLVNQACALLVLTIRRRPLTKMLQRQVCRLVVLLNEEAERLCLFSPQKKNSHRPWLRISFVRPHHSITIFLFPSHLRPRPEAGLHVQPSFKGRGKNHDTIICPTL